LDGSHSALNSLSAEGVFVQVPHEQVFGSSRLHFVGPSRSPLIFEGAAWELIDAKDFRAAVWLGKGTRVSLYIYKALFAQSLNSLASLYWEQGMNAQAEMLYTRSLALGTSNPLQ
jgi:hypothetical protein